jgi:hypothetical protein
MNQLKVTPLALLALLALVGATSTKASAEEGALLKRMPPPITISGGELSLETLAGESITCKSLTGEATFLEDSDQKATGSLTMKECKASGFPASTLGAGSGTLKATFRFLICLATATSLTFGLLIEPTEVLHIEIPALKILLLVKGSTIAENLSGNAGRGGAGKEFEIILAGKAGDQSTALQCEVNGARFKHSLEAGIDTKADVMASETTTAVVTFSMAVELLDT